MLHQRIPNPRMLIYAWVGFKLRLNALPDI